MTEVPAWLFDDEKKHRKRPVPVTKDMVEEYKQKWREINARPIKRVAEAKARKKRRVRVLRGEMMSAAFSRCLVFLFYIYIKK